MFLLGAAAYSSDDDGAAPTTGPESTTVDDTTTTSDPSTTTTSPSPTADWIRCESPAGFAVSYPGTWQTNSGDVVPECSQFDPDSFTVPEATDERVAAVNAFVEQVPFTDVAPPEEDEADRAVTVVDGRQAIRVVEPAGELYGDDTEATRYLIDLSLGVDDGPGTLFVDVVDLEGIDYDRAVSVLDRMVRSIDLTIGEEAPSDWIARYEGAAPFSGALTTQDGEPCLTVPTQGEPQTKCFTVAAADALRVADYGGELFSAVGGVAGRDVFRVELEQEGSTFAYLPVSTDDVQARGWVAPVGFDGVREVRWYALDGTQLGARTLEENGVEPVGEFQAPPVSSDAEVRDGETAFLRDVRVAPHDGFDRVVFEFGGDVEAPSYEIDAVEEVRATSGETVTVEGETTLRVTMRPAGGVDLSGEQPVETYEGPEMIRPGSTASVAEVTEVEDFEAVLTWAIGLDREPAVAVSTLSSPTRLVIDVAT